MAINIKTAKWLKYDGKMHSFQGGGGVKFMADGSGADIPLPRLVSALELDELEWFVNDLKP